jgi:ABC-type antimicrobial peptide transport system permease subunit
MRIVIKILVGLFLAFVLVQFLDLSFFLMNQSDTFSFNIGLITFGVTFVAFGFLGLYLFKVIKPKEEVKEEVKQEKEEQL